MHRFGLILEGGGMRGIYTAGVLDRFLEEGIDFPWIAGVSAGACSAISYLSRQHGRTRDILLTYAAGPDYVSIRNLIRTRSVFGMDFIFDRIPNELIPFDYDAYGRSTARFLIVATDCSIGRPVYFVKDAGDRRNTALRASSALPFGSTMVTVDGRQYLDGGIADPVPVAQSVGEGNDRHVVVLTRNAGYVKKRSMVERLLLGMYRRYPALQEAIRRRSVTYNESVALAERLEREGTAIIIRPKKPLRVTRFEKRRAALDELYEEGREEARACCAWLRR